MEFPPLVQSNSTDTIVNANTNTEDTNFIFSYQDIYSPPSSPLLQISNQWIDSLTTTTTTTLSSSSSQTSSHLMRTVYLGGLSPEISLEEVLNHVKGGLIEQVKLFPEKNCCFITFLDAHVAQGLHAEAQTRRFLIGGCDIKIGWGKQSSIPPQIINAVMNGATRNVFIGNIDECVTEHFLRIEFQQFGEVDHIKILYEKRIAFVHMAGIGQAMQAVATLQLEPSWMTRRVHYGRDRCAPSGLNPLASLPLSLIGSHLLKNGDPNCLMAPLNSPGNIPNRTIYIGGIHPEVTTKDICDTIRGGILQHIKYMAEKNIAFVTFVDSECANLFYDRTQLEGLIFKGKRVKVGWGKATPLPTSVQIAVQSSLASRNVYIGSIDDQMSEQRLLRDFGEFGDIELINIISDKNIAFVNFTDILSAIRAVEVMKNCSDYHRYKINYGKDRCGNIPRSPRSINHHSNSTVFNSQILSEQQVTQQSLLHQSFFESLLNTSPQNTTPHNFAQQPWSDQSALNLQSTPQRPPSTLGIRPSTPLSSSNGNNYYSSSSLQYTNDNDAEYTSMLGNFSKYNLNPPGFNEHQMRQNAFQSKFEREFFGGVGTIGSSRSPNKFGNTIVRQNSAPSMW